jgi:hypothetical protein
MTQSPYPIGYGRPPEHTRFQKGQSGNPNGKTGPKKRLKHEFDAALSGALDGDRGELRDAKPTKVIEALAHKVALDALDGRASALKLVLAILDGEDRDGAQKGRGHEDRHALILRQAQDEGQRAVEESRDETDEEDEEEADEENGEEDRFVFEDEHARQLFGDRYDEFKERFERAVNAVDIDALCDLAADFADANFPWCREKSREV